MANRYLDRSGAYAYKAIVLEYDPNQTYSKGDIIEKDGVLFKANGEILAGTSFSEGSSLNQFQAVSGAGGTAASLTTYESLLLEEGIVRHEPIRENRERYTGRDYRYTKPAPIMANIGAGPDSVKGLASWIDFNNPKSVVGMPTPSNRSDTNNFTLIQSVNDLTALTETDRWTKYVEGATRIRAYLTNTGTYTGFPTNEPLYCNGRLIGDVYSSSSNYVIIDVYGNPGGNQLFPNVGDTLTSSRSSSNEDYYGIVDYWYVEAGHTSHDEIVIDEHNGMRTGVLQNDKGFVNKTNRMLSTSDLAFENGSKTFDPSFSFSLTFKPNMEDEPDDTQYIISSMDHGNAYYFGLAYNKIDKEFMLYFDNSNPQEQTFKYDLKDGQWYHIRFEYNYYDNSNTLFIDGNRIGTITFDYAEVAYPYSRTGVALGYRITNSTSLAGSNHAGGYLGEFFMHQGHINKAERSRINNHMNKKWIR